MSKIPYAHEGQEAPESASVYRALKESLGLVPNVAKLVGHSGPATQALGAVLDAYFHRLSLTARIREIAYLTVARTNACSYCQGHHVPLARKAGLSDAEIELLGPRGAKSPLLSEAERAVVWFAYETTRQVAASDPAIEALKRNFTAREIAEIAFVVAAGNFIQRIGRNLGAELEFSPQAKDRRGGRQP